MNNNIANGLQPGGHIQINDNCISNLAYGDLRVMADMKESILNLSGEIVEIFRQCAIDDNVIFLVTAAQNCIEYKTIGKIYK